MQREGTIDGIEIRDEEDMPEMPQKNHSSLLSYINGRRKLQEGHRYLTKKPFCT